MEEKRPQKPIEPAAPPHVEIGRPPAAPPLPPPTYPPPYYGMPWPAPQAQAGPQPPPATGPQPPGPPPQGPPAPPLQYGGYYPPYQFYPPYYPMAFGAPAAPRPLEPRQLRTALGLDTAVFGVYVLAAAFVWGAIVGLITIAAMIPTLGGTASLGPTESGWLAGVMVARVIVWVMFILAAILLLAAMARFHEGRAEFGGEHERRHREFQAATVLFAFLVGAAGVAVLILSYNPASPITGSPLRGLQDSLRLTGIVWGVTGAAAAFLLSVAFLKVLRPFLPQERLRALRIVPVVLMFVPLLHAGLAVSFTDMAAIDTGTWSMASLRAAGEAGGLAGVAAALPLIVLVRALRAAHARILSGEVPSASAKKQGA